MANILIFTYQIPFPLNHGANLRIFQISRQLNREHDCFLASLDRNTEELEALIQEDIYRKVDLIPENNYKPRFCRHLRLSDENMQRRAFPKYYWQTVEHLTALKKKYRIDVVVTFFAAMSPFIHPIPDVKKIVDCCDSMSLAKERKYREERRQLSAVQRIIALLMIYRATGFERRLLGKYDILTSVSPVDQKRLKMLTGGSKDEIVLAPNGVAPELIHRQCRKQKRENSIIFWGNIPFPPNHSAVQFFYKEIFMPFLREKGITWYIAGGNPPYDVLEMAARHREIVVTGYMENLFEFAESMPIMVNPMVMGSGLKNKVLEAFALKCLVVSNDLGIEAISDAKDGVHYVHAETPEEFATAIFKNLDHLKKREEISENARKLVKQNYTWDRMGDQWLKWVSALTGKNG